MDELAARISRAIQHLVSGESITLLGRDEAAMPLGFLLTGFLRFLYSAFGETTARRPRTTEQCTTCGHCVRTCPMENISIADGRVVFGDNCVLCVRCVNTYPREALQVGKLDVVRAPWHGPRGGYSRLCYRTPRVFSQTR